MAVDGTSSYKSPTYKLLSFFPKSRDKWKAKCMEAKRENRSLKYCLAKMTEKRDRWKAKARELEKQIRDLEKQIANVSEAASVEEQPPKSKKRDRRSAAGRSSTGCRGRRTRPVVVAGR
jgi:septal ring factor EnvC (AmiA/AmiB activator)